MNEFVGWLASLRSGPTDKVRLIAHNGHSLETPLLSANMSRYGGPDFNQMSSNIVFSDSLHSFQRFLPQFAPFSFESLNFRYRPEGPSRTNYDTMDIALDLRDLIEGFVSSQVGNLDTFLAGSERPFH